MYIIHLFPWTHFSVAENFPNHKFLLLCNAVALKMLDFFSYLNLLCNILVWNKCEGIFCSSPQHWSKSASPSKGSLTLLFRVAHYLWEASVQIPFPDAFAGMLFRHSPSFLCYLYYNRIYMYIFFLYSYFSKWVKI